ncbi:hypothetical protein A6U89_02380 [Agrobacterium sp. B133/95]|nr:hypothetical protein A6U89_02380 [Agrobacterium sp. B133/95]
MAPAEFDKLLVAHIPLIRAAAYRRLPNDADKREDLVQEALLYVLERRAQYDPERGSIATFLRWQLKGVWGGCNNRAAINRLKHELPILMNEEGELFIDAPVFDDPAYRVDLERTLETMSRIRDGDLLLELYIDGREGTDIARERGVSPQAINQAMTRARERLVRYLNGEEMKPADFAAEPHQFVLRPDPVPSAADAALAVHQGGEQEERKPDRVWFTSTSALSRFVDMMQAAGVVMPAAPARSILSLHH